MPKFQSLRKTKDSNSTEEVTDHLVEMIFYKFPKIVVKTSYEHNVTMSHLIFCLKKIERTETVGKLSTL